MLNSARRTVFSSYFYTGSSVAVTNLRINAVLSFFRSHPQSHARQSCLGVRNINSSCRRSQKFFSKFWDNYENLIGVTDVKTAQCAINEAEKMFTTTQQSRREKQLQLNSLTPKLKTIQSELDRTSRGEDRYLALITEEHGIIRKMDALREELEYLENQERDHFTALSSAVGNSREQERLRSERTKYWGLIGSVVGAIIGMTGTMISYFFRNRALQLTIENSTSATSKTHELVGQLSTEIAKQSSSVRVLISDVRKTLNRNSDRTEHSPNDTDTPESDSLSLTDSSVETLLIALRDQGKLITHDLSQLKVLAERQIIEVDGEKILIDPDHVEKLLSKTQSNIEWKIKMNSLATVALTYGVLVIGLPLFYHIFSQ